MQPKMVISKGENCCYEFDHFRLDPARRRLLRDGELLPLPPKVFDLLLVLVQHAGQPQEKNDLIKVIWPDTFVEEANLNVNVSALRKALGEKPNEHRYIETMPRRGYRFVSNVREVEPEEENASLENVRTAVEPGSAEFAVHPPPAEDARPVPSIPSQPSRRLSLGWIVAVISAGVVIVAVILGLLFFGRKEPPHAAVSVSQLTSLPGREVSPAFSPDGNQIAFAWSGEADGNEDIYVRLVDGSNLVRLTDNPAEDLNPVWSPDGRRIAFFRHSAQKAGIYLIPSLGGAERKLADTFANRFALAPRNYIDWSPDGQWIAASDKSSAHEPFRIAVLSPETGERRWVSAPPASTIGDLSPAFSPDGKKLAFVHVSSAVVEDIYVMPTNGGAPQRLTFDNALINNLTWTADGREIVFSARRNLAQGLWKIPVAGGKPEWIAEAGSGVFYPVVAPHGNRIAYSQVASDINLWQVDLTSPGKASRSLRKLVASTQAEIGPQYSPDGNKIVFVSNRSGSYEIWMCDREGGNQVQLTTFRGPVAGSPRWSPDGRQIVFDSRPDGNPDIFAINSEGGMPRRLTSDASEDVVPNWSQDGRWIYFTSNRTGRMEIWKMASIGGEATQVTRDGGFEAVESLDGQWLYYAKARGSSAIWRVPTAGGEPSFVFDFNDPDYSRMWAITNRGIYFAKADTSNRSLIQFFNFDSGKTTTIAATDKALPKGHGVLTVAPDGSALIFPQLDQQGSDIMLLENLH
jgi:Tol biopolymer transport system component/DNA-binding winged helix-turn-helix (wHTH) protein